MRVKRFITFTLLLLANVFLLAHAVLPHVHHDGVVCFSLQEIKGHHHCTEGHTDACDCCCEQNKETSHHHHHNSEGCDLKEVVVRHDTSDEEIIPCESCLLLMYTIYPLNDLFLVEPEYEARLPYKPYLISYISPYVGSIQSLRAPPLSCFLG